MRWSDRPDSVSTRPESASQFSSKYWDALSDWGGLRKLHPRILAWNGTDFPNRRSKGNRIPLWGGGCGQKPDRDLARIGVSVNR